MNQQQILERKQRGYEISQRLRIKKDGEFYIVPSSKTGKYKVSLFHQTCECLDFQTRRAKCKHLYGVEYFVDQEFLNAIDNIPAEVKETPKKRTYPQPDLAFRRSMV